MEKDDISGKTVLPMKDSMWKEKSKVLGTLTLKQKMCTKDNGKMANKKALEY